MCFISSLSLVWRGSKTGSADRSIDGGSGVRKLDVWIPKTSKGPKSVDTSNRSRALFRRNLTQAELDPYLRSQLIFSAVYHIQCRGAWLTELTRPTGVLTRILLSLGRKMGRWSPRQNATSFDFAPAQSTSATPLFTLGVVGYTRLLLDLKADLSSVGPDIEGLFDEGNPITSNFIPVTF
ncbi:hypothetical protein BDN72DRAFT_862846 [Pluteus cervinus]|uniref:Uncharacterized protein n=1 Tax=Pluteus cervinus TaxID=181527 RepID=A0ACD3A9X2_9AGAR|nr:hypothetical protein BDN72DRAFT_862846 [Pluteus cervinus]